MAYRAPELFNISSEINEIDEKIDIWVSTTIFFFTNTNSILTNIADFILAFLSYYFINFKFALSKSLGCLLYAMAFLQSPFEFQVNERGGNLALAIVSGKYEIPPNR